MSLVLFIEVHLNEETWEVLILVKKVRGFFLNSSSVYKGIFVLKMFAEKEACQNKCQ